MNWEYSCKNVWQRRRRMSERKRENERAAAKTHNSRQKPVQHENAYIVYREKKRNERHTDIYTYDEKEDDEDEECLRSKRLRCFF